MMFGACGAGPSELFWGWGSLFKGNFKLINLICINPLMVKNLDNIIEFLITGMHNPLPKLNHFIQQINLGKLILKDKKLLLDSNMFHCIILHYITARWNVASFCCFHPTKYSFLTCNMCKCGSSKKCCWTKPRLRWPYCLPGHSCACTHKMLKPIGCPRSK